MEVVENVIHRIIWKEDVFFCYVCCKNMFRFGKVLLSRELFLLQYLQKGFEVLLLEQGYENDRRRNEKHICRFRFQKKMIQCTTTSCLLRIMFTFWLSVFSGKLQVLHSTRININLSYLLITCTNWRICWNRLDLLTRLTFVSLAQFTFYMPFLAFGRSQEKLSTMFLVTTW